MAWNEKKWYRMGKNGFFLKEWKWIVKNEKDQYKMVAYENPLFTYEKSRSYIGLFTSVKKAKVKLGVQILPFRRILFSIFPL